MKVYKNKHIPVAEKRWAQMNQMSAGKALVCEVDAEWVKEVGAAGYRLNHPAWHS